MKNESGCRMHGIGATILIALVFIVGCEVSKKSDKADVVEKKKNAFGTKNKTFAPSGSRSSGETGANNKSRSTDKAADTSTTEAKHSANSVKTRNLIPNPGFELSLRSWKLWPRTTKARFERDPDIHKKGDASARLTISNVLDRTVIYTYVKLRGGRNYVFDFWYRLQNFKGADGIKINLLFNNAKGGNGSAGTLKLNVPASGTDGLWRLFSREFRAPSDAVCGQLGISLNGVNGVVWLDALRITEVSDSVVVKKIKNPPVIDGQLDDLCWSDADTLSHFYVMNRNARAARTPTVALMAYDDANLYLAFRNTEPRMDSLKCDAKNRDSAVYNDDCDEIFIAASKNRMFQFIVNCGNVRWDGRITQRVPGDPYKSDKSWNAEWRSAIGKSKGEWFSEVSIPLSVFGDAKPRKGDVWRVNLARERHGFSEELSHWNRMEGKFNAVPKFAIMTFGDSSAVLKRFSEDVSKNPFSVERKNAKFTELLTDAPGNYIVGDWGCHGYLLGAYPKKYREKYTPESFRREQDNFLNEHGEAGMDGPTLPWCEWNLGIERIKSLNKRYEMKFKLALMSSWHSNQAKKKGAVFCAPKQKRVNCVDPVFSKVLSDYIVSYFQKHKNLLPFVNFVRGVDEPMNTFAYSFSRTCNTDHEKELDALDLEIKRNFGFGKYGLCDLYQNNGAVVEDALAKIATLRWWNTKFAEETKKIQRLLRKRAPGIPYIAANANCCSGLSSLDVAKYCKNTDWVSCDPYPTATLASFGRNRALYHTGFSVKVTRDVSGGKPTICIPQGFIYHGRGPSPRDMREWASQALKNGAGFLEWYTQGPFRITLPESYKEMLRLAHVISRMKRLKLPEKTKTAILLSNYSRWGTNDNVSNGAYTVYSILGEHIGSWFRFLSESTLAEKLDSLNNYGLLYVPQLKYCDVATAKRMKKFVENGGTIVFFDPESLQWNLKGEPFEKEARSFLIGGSLGVPRIKSGITTIGDSLPGIARGTVLPVSEISNRENAGSVMAYDIDIPENSKVFARYQDEKPAGYSRKVGKGNVFYFAAQPFGDSTLAVKPGVWMDFFKSMAKKNGESIDLPVWSFLLPEKGGEIPVNYIVKPLDD